MRRIFSWYDEEDDDEHNCGDCDDDTNFFVLLADTTQRRRQQRHLQPHSCHEICQRGKHFTKSHEIWQSEELNYLGMMILTVLKSLLLVCHIVLLKAELVQKS